MRWLMGTLMLWTAVGVCLGVDAGVLSAQVAVDDLRAGTVVRVQPASPRKGPWVPGRLLEATTDSIHLYTSGRRPDTLHFAVADLKKIEMSMGRHRRAGRGAIVGGIVGGTIGLVAGLAASSDDGNYLQVGPTDIAIVTVVVGAFGAGIGALIGQVSHIEYWRPVPRSLPVAAVVPMAGVLNVGLKIPW